MVGKKPPQRPKGEKPVWEKMSKSKGNGVQVDEVVFGVMQLARGFEFRDLVGDVIDYKAWGVWRDRGSVIYDTHVFEVEGVLCCRATRGYRPMTILMTTDDEPVYERYINAYPENRKPMLFYTASKYKNEPVFLHRKGNPVPMLFIEDGFEYVQHQYLLGWWEMMLDKHEFSPFKYENLLDHIGYYDELPTFSQLRRVVKQRTDALAAEDPQKSIEDHWFEAERQLFKGLTKEGGYVVSICDRTLEENQGFHHHWSPRHVSPKGVREYRPKKVDS